MTVTLSKEMKDRIVAAVQNDGTISVDVRHMVRDVVREEVAAFHARQKAEQAGSVWVRAQPGDNLRVTVEPRDQREAGLIDRFGGTMKVDLSDGAPETATPKSAKELVREVMAENAQLREQLFAAQRELKEAPPPFEVEMTQALVAELRKERDGARGANLRIQKRLEKAEAERDQARETNASFHRRVQALEGPWQGRIHAALNEVLFLEAMLRESRRTEAIAVRTLKALRHRADKEEGNPEMFLTVSISSIDTALTEIKNAK